MLRRYSVTAQELLTGESPTPEIDCDGYVIMGFVRGEDGSMEQVRISMHGISNRNVVEGLYSNPELRRCAQIMTEVEKIHNRPWRRLWRWLRGEQDEQEA